MTRFCRLLAALLLVLVASAPAPAAAQAAAHTRVALVAPQDASPEAREVLVRAQGELVAAGFEVVPVTAAAGAAPEGMLAAAPVPGKRVRWALSARPVTSPRRA